MSSVRAALAAVASAALVLVGGTSPATALTPTIEHQQFVRDLYNRCPDFEVHSRFFVDRRVTTYHDEDGTPIRQTIVGVFPGYVENVTTGYTLPAENVRIITVDLLTGQSMSRGTNVRVFLPGGGTIQLTAGLQIRDATGTLILEAGRLDQPPTPELCDALAQG